MVAYRYSDVLLPSALASRNERRRTGERYEVLYNSQGGRGMCCGSHAGAIKHKARFLACRGPLRLSVLAKGYVHLLSERKRLSAGDTVLLVDINDLLNLIVTAHEDTAAVVDVLGGDGHHAVHVAVDGLTTG
ncbi:hypothetical protein KC361_g29 [Hortaea werneckii]|nr:hypothetical protein KC361_g29 [Hortaea werneckii]